MTLFVSWHRCLLFFFTRSIVSGYKPVKDLHRGPVHGPEVRETLQASSTLSVAHHDGIIHGPGLVDVSSFRFTYQSSPPLVGAAAEMIVFNLPDDCIPDEDSDCISGSCVVKDCDTSSVGVGIVDDQGKEHICCNDDLMSSGLCVKSGRAILDPSKFQGSLQAIQTQPQERSTTKVAAKVEQSLLPMKQGFVRVIFANCDPATAPLAILGRLFFFGAWHGWPGDSPGHVAFAFVMLVAYALLTIWSESRTQKMQASSPPDTTTSTALPGRKLTIMSAIAVLHSFVWCIYLQIFLHVGQYPITLAFILGALGTLKLGFARFVDLYLALGCGGLRHPSKVGCCRYVVLILVSLLYTISVAGISMFQFLSLPSYRYGDLSRSETFWEILSSLLVLYFLRETISGLRHDAAATQEEVSSNDCGGDWRLSIYYRYWKVAAVIATSQIVWSIWWHWLYTHQAQQHWAFSLPGIWVLIDANYFLHFLYLAATMYTWQHHPGETASYEQIPVVELASRLNRHRLGSGFTANEDLGSKEVL